MRLQFYIASFLVVVGAALLVAGFIVDPLGVISPSVYVSFGEILTFVGAIFGIDYHYKSKTKE